MRQTTSPSTAALSSKWQPYPEYKDSGVTWLGEIPAHWEVKRLKNIVTMNPEVLPEDTNPDHVIKYVDISNVDANGLILGTQELRFEDAPSRARRMVKHGDTIISTVRTYLRAIALIMDPSENFVVSTGFAVLRPGQEVCDKFLWRLVQSNQFVDAVVSHSEGVGYPAINPGSLAALPVWLPPLPEQRAIAAFLDRETARINTLIAKKERLIELLQEKRAALISHAVTKGLDPAVKMRDTGIEWLGEIPAHWEILSLKRIAKIRYGLGQPPPQLEDGIPFVRATNVKSGKIVNEEMLYVDPTDIPLSRDAQLSPGEIIVVRSGAYTGDSAIVPEEYGVAIAGYDMVVTIANGYRPFIAWQLLSNEVRDLQFSFYKLRAAQPHLNAEELGNTLLSLPPAREQQAIVAYLGCETAKIDALIDRIREGIAKVQEYSAALIAAAVTGKIDAREAG